MILGLCGSPRAKTTEYVLRKALEMLVEQGVETEFYTVRGKNLGFCIHCDHCIKGKGCILQDDMQGLYPLMEEAEGFIIATPVYNGGVSAQTKTVMDRTRALLTADPKAFRGKAGAAIAIWGSQLFIPFFQAADGRAFRPPRMIPVVAWTDIGLICAAFALALILAQTIMLLAALRRGVFQALRMGDRE